MSVAVLGAIVLAGVWCLVIGEFSVGQVLLGLVFGSAFVAATGAGRGRVVPFSELPVRIGCLAFYLLVLIPFDIVRSNLGMARRLLRRVPAISPGIVRFPLRDLPRTAVALEEHAMTLSPGQMVVDYSRDERMVYVHLIDINESEGRTAALWRRYHDLLGRVFS